MRKQGADPDAVASFIDESLAELDDEDAEEELEVWPENAESFRVFQHCEWERSPLAGAEKAMLVFTGIPTSEVNAVCEMLQVASERRAKVLAGVRIMVAAALPLMNDKGG